MLIYGDIISKLSDEMKIRLLTDINSFSADERENLGIPQFEPRYLRHMMRGHYPSPGALAHAWDTELISSVARDTVVREVSRDSANLIMTPGAKVKLSPYRNEISEDTYLSAKYSAAFAKGVASVGACAAISGYYITDTDTDWLDKNPADSIMHEFIISPYARAVKDGAANAVMVDRRMLSGSYSRVNALLSDAVCKKDSFGTSTLAILERATDEDTVKFISSGGVCLRGSALSLETALNKYKKLKKSHESGDVTMGYIEEEIAEGRAISPEIIDSAVDRVLALMFKSSAKGIDLYSPQRDVIERRAVEKSIVLLKNSNSVLPLAEGAKISIIGGIATDGKPVSLSDKLSSILSQRGYVIADKTPGYSQDDDITKKRSVIDRALAAVRKSDITLLFLGHGDVRGKKIPVSHKLSIPANQLELVDNLSRYGKKIIIVLESGYGADVGFARYFAGLMLAPFGMKYDMSALADVLTGALNPSGRLAYTLYSSMDEYSEKHGYYREKFGIKSGRFVGYRYYTTADVGVGYHFGHGLSYTRFEYSGLQVTSSHVRFNVTNVGEMAGCETAQVYAGMEKSSVHRPKRELCGYATLELRPGESKTVNLDIELPKIYDPKCKKYIAESGEYVIGVGSSSSDIHLTGTVRGGDVSITERDNDSIIDYFQTESNILRDKYTLEAGYKLMNKSVKNILSGVGAIILAICLGVYNALTSATVFLGILTSLLAVAGIAFFVAELYEKNKTYEEEREKIDKENEKHFEDAEKLPEFSAEKMFKNEFDTIEEEIVAQQTKISVSGKYDESLKYIDKNVDFGTASREFALYATEHGVAISEEDCAKIFASLASSRLLVFKDTDSELFGKLATLLSEYFGAPTYADNADGYSSEESVLYAPDNEGHRIKKNVAIMLENAVNATHTLHIGALNNVKCSEMINYFAPYARYAKNPTGYTVVTAHNEYNRECGFFISQNVWFLVNLGAEECYDEIPDFIADIATVNTVKLEKRDAAYKVTPTTKFAYYQLGYLAERAADAYAISEDMWKKVDAVEKYVKSVNPDFHIDNKLCLAFERCVSALMAIGVDRLDALDRAISLKMLPALIIAVCGRLGDGDKTLTETFDSVFGEGSMVESLAVLKNADEFTLAAKEERRRLEEEARAEAERLERERIEAEKAEAERLERERLEAERAEAERLELAKAAEQAERERLEREKAEREQAIAEAASAEAPIEVAANEDVVAPELNSEVVSEDVPAGNTENSEEKTEESGEDDAEKVDDESDEAADDYDGEETEPTIRLSGRPLHVELAMHAINSHDTGDSAENEENDASAEMSESENEENGQGE